MEKIKISKWLRPIYKTNNQYSNWFGYYTFDTLDTEHKKMLCNRASFDGCELSKGMEIEFGYLTVLIGNKEQCCNGFQTIVTESFITAQKMARLSPESTTLEPGRVAI
jgi:hypothetical protein